MSSKIKGLSSSTLHILAMFFMLCDHAHYTVLSNYPILTCIGRLAFHIFAFMLVEGFYHTSNKKRYLLRLLLFGLISEIPFNLMLSAQIFYPMHQNVMFNFALGLCMIWGLDIQRKKMTKDNFIVPIVLCGIIVFIFTILGIFTFVDYQHAGILMVFTFFISRKKNWVSKVIQILLLYYINFELLGGLVYPVTIGALSFEVPRQGLAILSLLFIWLYNGQKGYNAKWFKYFCYAFYPAHSLILFWLACVLYF